MIAQPEDPVMKSSNLGHRLLRGLAAITILAFGSAWCVFILGWTAHLIAKLFMFGWGSV